jgi:hypothetical protein
VSNLEANAEAASEREREVDNVRYHDVVVGDVAWIEANYDRNRLQIGLPFSLAR